HVICGLDEDIHRQVTGGNTARDRTHPAAAIVRCIRFYRDNVEFLPGRILAESKNRRHDDCGNDGFHKRLSKYRRELGRSPSLRCVSAHSPPVCVKTGLTMLIAHSRWPWLGKSAATFLAWAVLAPGSIRAQSTPITKSLSHAIHAVNDLDTTLAFYRDVFGIKGNPQDFPNTAVPLLTNAPGVTLRLSMLALRGNMRFELTHFMGLERRAAQAKYTDPGAASVVFHVRDIDALVANAKKANAPIITDGGIPVEISTANGKARSIIMRDPDGFFVQLVQDAPAAGAPEGNVHRVSLAYTMENAEATANFYTGLLGIDLSAPTAFSKDPAMLKLYGAPAGTEFRKLTGVLPGPNAAVEFTEFKGVPRT